MSNAFPGKELDKSKTSQAGEFFLPKRRNPNPANRLDWGWSTK
jgi:hypothetical protein